MGRGRFYSHGIPQDPKPSLKIEGGRIVELDGKRREDFDLIGYIYWKLRYRSRWCSTSNGKDSKRLLI